MEIVDQHRSRIAVLLTVYWNEDALKLENAIESVLNQHGVCVVCYLAIDGPVPKNIDQILTKYSDKIRVLRFEENRGLAKRLNDLLDAIDIKAFDFIARMDADDISTPDRFSKQVNYLNEHQDIDVLGTALVEIGEDGKKGFTKVLPACHEDLYYNFLFRCPVSHPTVMLRTRVFLGGYRYNERFLNTQDYELWMRLMADGFRFANLPDVCLRFSIGNGFYKRRGIRKVKNEIYVKVRAMFKLNLFSIKALIFIVAFFIIRVSPAFVQKIVYQRFR
ncbi:glycosyltransferase [Zooshikella ganghwensis]|uniref:Glycosyltransferase n=1 Tax=Zooshikella ganghwensis TaxID=202772 RepID=A0A4P9VM30_9GAMM|nr:glycosyltransferase [Zooshikella ganghwensis]RDH43160.1 glycosyltransferase [Zooshikella ganghwensis]